MKGPHTARLALAAALAMAATLAPATAAPTHAVAAYRYYFQWFDIASPGMSIDNIHIVNPSATAVAHFTIAMPGQTAITGSAQPHQERLFNWPWPAIGGPVEVDSDSPVIASQRVVYYRSFNEIPAVPATDADTSLWFAWYDRASDLRILNDNLHLLNPGATDAHATVTLGSSTLTATVPAGGVVVTNFPWGSIGGPVHITSDVPILASQRVQYAGSFNEIAAKRDSAAASTLVFNWYDYASPGFTSSFLHVVNPTTAPVTVNVALPGHPTLSADVPPGAEHVFGYPFGTIGGPVTITATGNVIASQRVLYWNAFKEYWALSSADAVTDTYFNWYDDASPCFLADNIHLYGTGPGTSTVAIDIPGIQGDPSLATTVGAGAEKIVNFPPGTIGGPVHISVTAGPPVLYENRTVICPPPAPPPPPTPHPVRMRYPVAAYSANVETVGVDSSGAISPPSNIWDVGWFNGSPLPGDAGNAIVTGHVNWYNSGAALEGLPQIWIGALVYVDRDDGSTLRFVVDSIGYYAFNSPPSWMWSHSGPAQLVLITCDPYSSWTGSGYSEREVVHAHLG